MTVKLHIKYDKETRALLDRLETLLIERTETITPVLRAAIYHPPGAAGVVQVERELVREINNDKVRLHIKREMFNVQKRATRIGYELVEEEE